MPIVQSFRKYFKPDSKERLEAYAARGILVLAAVIGLASFVYCYLHGLSTVHWDAKAHLVMARRIVDSMAPGYANMGAHWLPLIHLLYLPFVLIESQYRTAVIPSLMSVCAFAISVWLIYRIAVRLTGSIVSGLFAAIVLLGNPNLLLVQSAPLTEPVYLAFSLLAFDGLLRWRSSGGAGIPWLSVVWAAIAALCRYEGWIFIGGVIVLLGYDAWTRRLSLGRATRVAAAYIGLFLVPIAAHFGYIYARLGDTFFQRVARGNPAPYETLKRPFLSIVYHFGELAQAAALVPLLLAMAGVVFCLMERERARRCLPYFLLWLPSLMNTAALSWGLVYRIRYSLLLLPAIAIFGSLLISQEKTAKRALIFACILIFMLPWVSWPFPRDWEYHFVAPSIFFFVLPPVALVLFFAAAARDRYRGALIVLTFLGMQMPALHGEFRAMMAESLEHRYIEPEQQQLIGYLRSHYDGSRILIDMGRLAPFMYDTGLPLKKFICHDGATNDWNKAVASPRSQVGWLFAEKGDEVWNRLQADSHWADGFALAMQTENYIMYQLSRAGREAPRSGGKLR